MTRFGQRIEPITSPTPGECANCYATDADCTAYFHIFWTNSLTLDSDLVAKCLTLHDFLLAPEVLSGIPNFGVGSQTIF